jgi:hypothetical protein
MQVVLHQDWACAPEGHTTLHFKAGDTLTGKAAEMALADGVGFTPVAENKIEPPLENKRGRRK